VRTLAGLTAALAIAACVGETSAEPRAAAGYAVEVITLEGAIFSGLAEESRSLVATNLADGRLYRFADGEFEAFGPELPHGTDVIGDPTGPYRILALGSSYRLTQGWTPADQVEGPYDHALLELDQAGAIKVISNDFWNPFDLLADGDALYVVDAAKNTVERIRADGSGKITLFTFPRLEHEREVMKRLSPTEFQEAEPYEVDAVPTGIGERDGRLYVSLFGGFPYVEAGGVVVSLDGDGPSDSARLEVDALETPVDITFHKDGRLLVLEHGRFDQATGFLPGTGRLIAVNTPTGERQTLIEGLTRPASLRTRADGSVVIASLDGTLTFVTDEE
jgi:hypothetical protein